jgi:ketosteroid isomerase-like protein
MSEANMEIVRVAIDAANRGDWDAAFKDAAPRFEWDNSRAMGADNRAVFSVGEAREFFRGMTNFWESSWIEIDELIPTGDHVVVPHTTHVRGRDGIEPQAHTSWLFTIRNAQIERVCLYQDKQEALDAAGLQE